MRRVHHVTGIAPFDLVRVGDCGDVPINPIDLGDALDKIAAFYRRRPRRRRDPDHGRRRPSDLAADPARRSRRTGRSA